MLLIKQTDNWADEIDIEAAFLITEDKWNSYLEKIKDVFPYKMYIGSNEFIEYRTMKHYLNSLTITHITEHEASILSMIIPNTDINWIECFGTGAFVNIDE